MRIQEDSVSGHNGEFTGREKTPLQPDAAQVAGQCECGGSLVFVPRHVGGLGTVRRVECWAGMGSGWGCPGKEKG